MVIKVKVLHNHGRFTVAVSNRYQIPLCADERRAARMEHGSINGVTDKFSGFESGQTMTRGHSERHVVRKIRRRVRSPCRSACDRDEVKALLRKCTSLVKERSLNFAGHENALRVGASNLLMRQAVVGNAD
jgi:hypothetical protein